MKNLYLLVDLCAVIVPLAFSFHPAIRFYKHFKAALISLSVIATCFILWDSYFTSINVWGFNKNYLTGIFIGNLPLEEILFFICIPYSCLFTWFVLKHHIPVKYQVKNSSRFAFVLGILFLIAAAITGDNIYTCCTLGLSGLLLLFSAYLDQLYMRYFYTTYLVLLIPFFIVNGILTGTGIEDEVVWYNNKDILGWRALTIPVEDFIYALLLILSNIMLFELLSKNRKDVRKA